MPMEGYISATVRLQPNQSTAALIAARGSTVILTRRSGQTIYGAGMWQTEDGQTNTDDGTLPLKFEGPLVTEEVATS
jgi:hypothetical protein